MLLCVGPSNQEVQSLPEVIDAWVRATHGETPDKRPSGADKVALFLVLTKMDLHFGEKEGAAPRSWTILARASSGPTGGTRPDPSATYFGCATPA